MSIVVRTVCVCLIIGIGCTLDDADRCPAGYVFASTSRTCIEANWCPEGEIYDDEKAACVPDSNDTDAVPGDAGSGDGSAVDDGFLSGCEGHDACESYAADYCAIDPDQTEGICTYQDCGPGTCPDGYQCCDFAVISAPKICVSDDKAAAVLNESGGLIQCVE